MDLDDKPILSGSPSSHNTAAELRHGAGNVGPHRSLGQDFSQSQTSQHGTFDAEPSTSGLRRVGGGQNSDTSQHVETYEAENPLLSLGQGTQWRPNPVTQDEINQTILNAFRDLQLQIAESRRESYREEPSFYFEGEDAEDPEDYIARLEDWLKRTDARGIRTMDAVKRTLRGRALNWFRVTCQATMDFRVFVTVLREKYNSLTVIGNLTVKLYGEPQKANETAASFIVGKWALFKRLAPTAPEGMKVAIIKELLLPDIKIHLSAANLQSLQQLVDVASQVERNVAAARKHAPVNTQDARYAGAAPRAAASGRAQARQEQEKTEERTQERSTPAARLPRTGDGPPFPCRFCGANHFHNECSDNPRNKDQGNAPRAVARGDARSENPSQQQQPRQ